MNKTDEATVRALVLLDRYHRLRQQLEAAKSLWGVEPTTVALAGYTKKLVEFIDKEYQEARTNLTKLLVTTIMAEQEEQQP